MSVKAMGKVWDLALPHHELLVLLAMADHADHEGARIYPSIDLLAWKTGYSPRQVQRIVHALCRKGLLNVIRKGGGRQRPTEYAINFEKGVKKSPFIKNSDNMSPYENINPVKMSPLKEEPCQNVTVTEENGDILSQNGDIAMSPEPSGKDLTYKRDLGERVGGVGGEDTAASPKTAKRPPARRIKTRFPEDPETQAQWKADILGDTFQAWAKAKQLPPAEIEYQWEQFTGKALANGYSYLNWRQAFQNWFHSQHYTPMPDRLKRQQALEAKQNPYPHDGHELEHNPKGIWCATCGKPVFPDELRS